MCDKYKAVCSIYSEYFCEDLKYFLIKGLIPEKSGRYGNDSPESEGSWGNFEYDEVRAETREMAKHLYKEKQDAQVAPSTSPPKTEVWPKPATAGWAHVCGPSVSRDRWETEKAAIPVD